MSLKRIWTAVLVSGVIVGGLVWADATGDAAAEGDDKAVPKLRCDEPVYEFEGVWAGEEVKHDYILHNDGDAPLEILQAKPTCGCTVAHYDKVIAPGKSGKVSITLRTRGMRKTTRKTIPVKTNDPETPNLVLTVKGTVKQRVDISPPTGALFGKVTDETTDLVRKVRITNNTEEKMKLELMPQTMPQKVFSAELEEVEAGKVYDLVVTAKRPFRDGNNYARFTLNTGIEEQPQVHVSARLESPPLIQMRPTMMTISAPATRQMARTFTITYNGEGKMALESAEPTHSDIGVEMKETQAGRAYDVTLQVPAGFDPGAGQQPAVVLKTNLKERPELQIPIRVHRRSTPRLREAQPTVTAAFLVGKPAPQGTVTSVEGRPLRVGADPDQVTVLNFWASWSEASRRQLSTVQQVSGLYRRKGVEFLNVSVDRMLAPAQVAEAAKRLDITMPVGVDPRHNVVARYGIESVPALFVIGKNGVVEALHEGAPKTPEALVAFEDKLKSELDEVLAGRSLADQSAGPTTADPSIMKDELFRLDATSARNMTGPRLLVESLRQDTGRHKPGAEVSYQLHMRNDGLRALTIASVQVPEGVKLDAASQKPRVLQPSNSVAAFCKFTVPTEPGPFEHKITINSNDRLQPKLQVTLVGEVKPWLELRPVTGVDFGRNPRTQSMGRMATITYNGSEPVAYLSAESSSPRFEATVEKIMEGPNAKVIVNTNPPFEVGQHDATITIKTDCEPQPTVKVPVTLYRPERIEIDPAEVELGHSAGLQRETIEIRNNGMESLHILEVSTSTRRIRTQFYPEPDGFSYKLELMFPANLPTGPEGEKVTIRTDDEEYEELVVHLVPKGSGGHASSR